MVATPVDTRASLKAICPRKDLFEAVQTVGHAVSGRSSLPILSHILLQAEDNALRLIATDLELGISCRIPARIEEGGGLTAPARTLTEVLANLPDKSEVAVSVDKSHTVRVHCDRSDYKILGLPAEDYPRLPEVKDAVSFSIPQAKLREMIRHTIFAVSPDESRAILTGILMVFDGETLKFVATDTHRLAVKTAQTTDGRGSQNAIVPSRAMNELTRLLTDGEGNVQVTLSDNQVRFALPGEADVQIISRLIEGQFPNYQRVIPAEYQKRLKIPVEALLRAVRRASIVARENSHRVVLRTEEDKLVLTAESQTVGNAYEEIEIEREGDDVEIAFNARYLLDVLNVLDEDEVHLELTEPLKPGVLRPIPNAPKDAEGSAPIEPDYLCVLMPMQIV
ncbi:MAG TPA: DNA polymerase III subunit beta [Chthonomonadaceae bacterium]|nr:DNA polymerase III subunit beta [Chthonomonadaceae bacterium]